MGFLDKLVRAGSKALGDVVADTLMNDSGEVGRTLRNVRDAVNSLSEADADRRTIATRTTSTEDEGDDRCFDEKLPEVIEKLGNGEYEIVRGLPTEELERRCGEEIYSKKNTGCKPSKITYEITRYGATVLYIRLWDDYSTYNRATNREIKRYCDSHGIKMLDFFEYLPNEVDYMEKRIGEQLG